MAAALAVAVGVVAALPFAGSTRYGLINCDDYDYANYAELTHGVTAEGVRWAFTFTGEGIWMPLTWLSYMGDHAFARRLGGDNGKFDETPYHVMHAHSVALHGLNAGLLFVLLFLLAGRRNWPLAALAALLWAVHPLRCESVDWVASRKDVLSMAGLLASLVCWVRGRQTPRGRIGAFIGWYVLSLLACAVGGLAKPSVMCYPALVAILDWFFLRREVATPEGVMRLCLAYVAPTGLAVALGASAYVMQGVGGCTVEFSDMPFWGRALNAMVSFGVYVLHTVFPVGLAPQCIMRWPHPPRLMVPALVAAGVLVWLLARHFRAEFWRFRAIFGTPALGVAGGAAPVALPLVAGGLWYAISVVPFLGISGFGWHAFADRFTYIPAVGASLAVLALARLGRGRVAGLAVLAAAVVAFGWLAARQTRVWSGDKTFWEQTIAVDGELNGVATAGLGLWHYEHGHDVGAAVLNYDKAFNVCPDYVQKTCFVYIDALAEHGDMERAYEVVKWAAGFSRQLREREEAVGGMPADEAKPIMHSRLARVACFLRDPKLAKIAAEELAELRADAPKSIHVWYLVARAALIKGDIPEAEKAWRKIEEYATRRDYVRYRFLPGEIARAKADSGAPQGAGVRAPQKAR